MFTKEPDLPFAFSQQEMKKRKKFTEYLFPSHKITPIGITMEDTIIMLFLLFIGIFTRIFRIQFPKEIVSNEDRIGQQINFYSTGQYFQNFENPPFTSLFYYFISTRMNYDGSFDYNFKSKFCPTRNHSMMNCIHIQFRTISAILSGFCPLFIYLTARIMLFLSSSSSTMFTIRLSSLTASLFYAFETSLISQERFMFIDGILHHFICCSLLFVYLDNFYMFWHTFILKSLYISLSFAVSPIHTIGILIATIIREFLIFKPKLIFKMNYALARSLSIIIFIIAFQYLIYYIHVKILPYNNIEIQKNENYEIPQFINESLIDRMSPNWTLRNKNQSIFKLFIQTTFLIFHRSEIKSNEKFESSIWKWPFGNFLKSILYSHDNNYSSNHYYACIPNIFVYLMVVSIICISCFLIYNKKNVTKKMKFYIDFTFLIIGYVTSILPFMFIQHTFLYNYSIALIFGILFFANAIEKLINPKISVYIYLTAIILTLFGFFYFSPYVYGLSQPSCSYFF